MTAHCETCVHFAPVTPREDLGRCCHPGHPMATPERFALHGAYQECVESNDGCALHVTAMPWDIFETDPQRMGAVARATGRQGLACAKRLDEKIYSILAGKP